MKIGNRKRRKYKKRGWIELICIGRKMVRTLQTFMPGCSPSHRQYSFLLPRFNGIKMRRLTTDRNSQAKNPTSSYFASAWNKFILQQWKMKLKKEWKYGERKKVALAKTEEHTHTHTHIPSESWLVLYNLLSDMTEWGVITVSYCYNYVLRFFLS